MVPKKIPFAVVVRKQSTDIPRLSRAIVARVLDASAIVCGRFAAFRQLPCSTYRSAILNVIEMSPSEPMNVNKQNKENKCEKPKLSARDVLTTLSEKRLSIRNIMFFQTDLVDGLRGGSADVQAATFTKPLKADVQGKPRKVAVKKIRYDHVEAMEDGASEEKFLRASEQLFANELQIVSRLSHPNIVELSGFVEDIASTTAWLVFPWEENGNLREFLQTGTWDIPERVYLASGSQYVIQEVAHGLEYLHTQEPPICHCDMKSLNVLINARHSAVITDFGSARILRGSGRDVPSIPKRPTSSASSNGYSYAEKSEIVITSSTTDLTLTGPGYSIRWAPPEALVGERRPGLTNDIWALGWIAWEAITGSYPFEDIQRPGKVTITIARGQMPRIREHSQLSLIGRLCDLMLRCWKLNPEKRPSAKEARMELGNMARARMGEQAPKSRSAALILQNGEIYRAAGKNSDALKLFHDAFMFCLQTGDRPLEVAALKAQAKTHQALSDYTSAEECLLRAQQICSNINDRLGEASTSKDIGDLRLHRGKYKEAERPYLRGLEIYISMRNISGVAGLLKSLGDATRGALKHSEARQLYSKAIDIYKDINDYSGEASTLEALASLQLFQSRYYEAEESYAVALDICTKMKDSPGLAKALKALGDVHLQLSEYAQSERLYSQALDVYRDLEDSVGEAILLKSLDDLALASSKETGTTPISRFQEPDSDPEMNAGGSSDAMLWKIMGDSYQEHLNWTQAEESYSKANSNMLKVLEDLQQARSKSSSPNNPSSRGPNIDESRNDEPTEASAKLMRLMGDVHLRWSQYCQAEDLYSKALDICRNIEDRLGEADVLRAFGNLHLAQLKLPKAEELYGEALNIYRGMRNIQGEAGILKGLGDVHLARSNYTKAEDFYLRALLICRDIKLCPEQTAVLKGLGDFCLGHWKLRQESTSSNLVPELERIFEDRRDSRKDKKD
ncbi:hypothetical protein FRB90_002012 [Tulasnella sp. 427]|nr:hypothetical protein FRB90_002012 [Tulasnella sp. 427]